MTAFAASNTKPFFVPANPSYGGTSASAAFLDRMLFVALSNWQRAAANKLRLSSLDEQLGLIMQECIVQGRDGYGAHPVSPLALREAKQLLEVLPKSLLPLEVVAEPHGGIAFQWQLANGRSLVVSMNGTKTLEFAAIYGPVDQDLGKRSFAGLFPPSILDLISKFQ